MNNLTENKENVKISEAPKKPVRKKGFFKKFKVPIIILIILGLGVGGYFAYNAFFPKKKTTTERTAQAKKADISTVITGSGAVTPISNYTIRPLAKGIIIKDTFNEGDMVKEGQLLYSIDQEDALTTIEKNKNALDKSLIDDKQNVENIQKLIINAPISGKITGITLNEGDNVGNNSKIATIINDQTLKLTVPFNAADTDRLAEGQAAEINLPEYMYNVNGTVSRIISGQRQDVGGMIVRDVEISVPTGGIKLSAKATAKVFTNSGDIVCNSPGTFEYWEQQVVTSEATGTANGIRFKNGDIVNKGDIILKLSSTSTTSTLEKSRISLNDAKLSLENSKKQLENYNITSPITGTVISKAYKSGDTLEQTNSATTMAVVADLSKMVLNINVDELDIAKVKKGQVVDITADALPKNKFKGIVDTVGLEGKSSNGVTTYPVKIMIDEPGELRANMNVNANIVVESKQNVLTVPISAVRRGNIVYIKKAVGAPNSTANPKRQQGEQSQDPNATPRPQRTQDPNATPRPQRTQDPNSSPRPTGNRQAVQIPEGYEMRRVETGINDQDNIEIVSGLKDGDVVQLPEIKGTSPVVPVGASPFGGTGGTSGASTRGTTGGFSGGTTRTN